MKLYVINFSVNEYNFVIIQSDCLCSSLVSVSEMLYSMNEIIIIGLWFILLMIIVQINELIIFSIEVSVVRLSVSCSGV